ncbi:MAG: hypothetical protein GYB31_10255 [Bacteroidetes bacterium]|nr:hypothetical protein [Bacteroidota bacterium]
MRFPAQAKALQYGVIAGAGMGIYLFVFKWLGVELSAALKFSKYIILIAALYLLFRLLKENSEPGEFFSKGIGMGAIASFAAAVILLVVNGFSWLVGGSATAINKFGNEPIDFGQLMLLEGVMFFEVLVFGMVGTFICLQFLKYGRAYEVNK